MSSTAGMGNLAAKSNNNNHIQMPHCHKWFNDSMTLNRISIGQDLCYLQHSTPSQHKENTISSNCFKLVLNHTTSRCASIRKVQTEPTCLTTKRNKNLRNILSPFALMEPVPISPPEILYKIQVLRVLSSHPRCTQTELLCHVEYKLGQPYVYRLQYSSHIHIHSPMRSQYWLHRRPRKSDTARGLQAEPTTRSALSR